RHGEPDQEVGEGPPPPEDVLPDPDGGPGRLRIRLAEFAAPPGRPARRSHPSRQGAHYRGRSRQGADSAGRAGARGAEPGATRPASRNAGPRTSPGSTWTGTRTTGTPPTAS